jgi:hypothetical protein
MTNDDIFTIAMAILVALAAIAALLRARRRAININNVGALYGLRRWNGESTDDFRDRIRAKATFVSHIQRRAPHQGNARRGDAR